MPRLATKAPPHDGWVSPILDALENGRQVLVVCRTSASQREILRRLALSSDAGRAGWAGLHVSTLKSFISTLLPQSLGGEEPESDASLPAGHPWRQLLENRPGLRGVLAEVVEKAREAQAAGVDLSSLRPEIESLVVAGWASSGRAQDVANLLKTPRQEQKVFSIGFTEARSSISPLDRAALTWLQAESLEPTSPSNAQVDPIPAVRAPDVIAEAREVVRRARGVSGRVLVLVADGASQERIRAAFLRNGVPVADDEAAPLHRHSLAAAIEPLLPLFGDATETVEAAALLRFLTDPVLSRKAPKNAPVVVQDVKTPRASVRHVRDLIVNCRRARGTLAEWIVALEGAEAQARETWAKTPASLWRYVSARVVVAQVRAIARHAQGATLYDVAKLIGDIGISFNQSDSVGRSITAALKLEGHRPADARSFADALTHTVGSGRVDLGAQLISYAAYDGRDADLVILTGVHSKGLAAAPAPSPFLSDKDLGILGQPTPSEAVAERLAQARWAVSRAKNAFAIVTATDASGRAVTPPVDLPLEYESDVVSCYGLKLDLPENDDCNAFEVNAKPSPLALQVDAEWARAGALFEEAPPPAPTGEPITLLDHLEHSWAVVPERLKPLLGGCGKKADGTSPLPDDTRLSASTMEAYTQCLYRAFARNVLGVRKADEVAEDLDVTEIGVAVHAALEQLEGEFLLVPADQLEAVRQRVLGGLEGKAAGKMEELVQNRPTGTDAPSLAFARKSLAAKWDAHYPAYLKKRITSLSDVVEAAGREALAPLIESPLFDEALTALIPGLKAGPTKDLRENIIVTLIETNADPKAFLDHARLQTGLKPRNLKYLATESAKPETRQKVAELCNEARKLLYQVNSGLKGDLELVDAEREVGTDEKPLRLTLGEGTYSVRGGRIDALALHRGVGQNSSHRVIDFKTGKAAKAEELTESLLKPQLAFYALALDAEGIQPPVGSLELDHVKFSNQVTATFDDAARAHALHTLGGLLDLGRSGTFPLAPHPRGCPHLDSGYCDYKDVCRMRPGTRSGSEDSEENGED